VAVEHSLAHIAARKGDSARYIGARKSLFDLRRSSAICRVLFVQAILVARRRVAATPGKPEHLG
jgi:hypothetical protein